MEVLSGRPGRPGPGSAVRGGPAVAVRGRQPRVPFYLGCRLAAGLPVTSRLDAYHHRHLLSPLARSTAFTPFTPRDSSGQTGPARACEQDGRMCFIFDPPRKAYPPLKKIEDTPLLLGRMKIVPPCTHTFRPGRQSADAPGDKVFSTSFMRDRPPPSPFLLLDASVQQRPKPFRVRVTSGCVPRLTRLLEEIHRCRTETSFCRADLTSSCGEAARRGGA